MILIKLYVLGFHLPISPEVNLVKENLKNSDSDQNECETSKSETLDKSWNSILSTKKWFIKR